MRIARYQAPNRSLWEGRKDEQARFHSVIRCVDLENETLPKPDHNAFALLGFACDAGIIRNQGRPGAVLGPDAFRKALAKLPVPDAAIPYFDLGNITCTDGDVEASQEALAWLVEQILLKGIHPIIVGGGHEVAWGHYQGIAKAFSNLDCAIVNIDAHLDLRPLLPGGKGSSGTSFTQIAQDRSDRGLSFDYTCIGLQKGTAGEALLEEAKKLNVRIVSAEEMHSQGVVPALKAIDQVLSSHDRVYLTVCLDVFAAPFAPGVSAPQPLGLLPWEVIPLIQHVARSGKMISFEIAELSPPLDKDGMTATLAASLVAAV